jgi:hypothetical protein
MTPRLIRHNARIVACDDRMLAVLHVSHVRQRAFPAVRQRIGHFVQHKAATDECMFQPLHEQAASKSMLPAGSACTPVHVCMTTRAVHI